MAERSWSIARTVDGRNISLGRNKFLRSVLRPNKHTYCGSPCTLDTDRVDLPNLGRLVLMNHSLAQLDLGIEDEKSSLENRHDHAFMPTAMLHFQVIQDVD